ncbi:helix-turn-helix domain-containing protein [Rossellomorea aquimaris]|uniref:helix-turn-helix domain-containing protein n=1 Tax=Rossellomorea aquimaris TaxID=189382 RepID=UPI001CD30EEB|nr:helix-turn-helix domain-containing protein [Rossellomorea aquimaris]MCA1056958.1 helix-turn-helix domain-containing protein [Rossellomorea aquimaris]
MYEDYYEVVTVEELADILRIGLSTAYRLVRTREIASFRVANSYRIEREAIKDFIIQNTQRQKNKSHLY